MAETALVWLRNDLRIAGNPALAKALARGGRVVAVYLHETDPALRQRGAASRWWLSRSLAALSIDLGRYGVGLEILSGPAEATLMSAVGRNTADAVFWNRRYEPAEREIDTGIKARLKEQGVEAHSFPGNVLAEPFEITTRQGGPYGVFTPFWRTLRSRDIPASPAAPPPSSPPIAAQPSDGGYNAPAWTHKLARHWTPGEASARARLEAFLDGVLGIYPEARDFPARDATSRLSPHLALGEIDVRLVWHAALAVAHHDQAKAEAVEKFLAELAWRDFNIHQLYHRPDIANVPMQPRFAALQWRESASDLLAWQRGQTGIPIVDAGMRELWETGFMHNRVRMLTASLLAKTLLLDWRRGEQWFWDCLVDADLASNPGNWQWVAGTGLDASPWFRIFNPLTQAERFDADQTYIRRWVPELGTSAYPAPIVDLAASRERALSAFKALPRAS